MKPFKSKPLYMPSLTIVALVVALFIFIIFSTFRNLNRSEIRAIKDLDIQAATLVTMLNSAIKWSYVKPVDYHIMWEQIIDSIGKMNNIAYVRTKGPGLNNRQDKPAHDPLSRHESDLLGHVCRTDQNKHVYEFTFDLQLPDNDAYHPLKLIVGLKMDEFEKARHADIMHAWIMLGIVFALGMGTLFFIYVIQKYYIVDVNLKQTQEYTRQVISNMPNGLLSIDLKGEIVTYNQLALDLLKIETDKAIGTDLSTIFDFTDSGIGDALKDGQLSLDKELWVTLKNQEKIALSISATPLLNSKQVCSGAVILIRDLSEIKRLEEKVKRAEKLAAIGKLAASVAHEIRNPLSSIKGFAQFLKHTLADRPKDQEYAQIIVKEMDRIDHVVNDLLTFARPMDVAFKQTGIYDVISHVRRLIQADIDASHIELKVYIQKDMPDVYMDPDQITQALLNLLLNAIQASPENKTIFIDASHDPVNNDLILAVEDQGKGIDPDNRARIFEPFFTTREKGTGLGLAIVHKIVEHHMGEIQILSPLPQHQDGCRFSIRIPINKDQ